MMKSHSKIFIAGHDSVSGWALITRLRQAGYGNLLLRSPSQIDLRDPHQVTRLFATQAPDYVFIASTESINTRATNTIPSQFCVNSLASLNNIVQAATAHGVKRLLLLGSAEIYSCNSARACMETDLTTDWLHSLQQAHTLGLRRGIELCQAYNCQYGTRFLTALTTKLYGPNDNFSHPTPDFLASLIAKIHNAKLQEQESVSLPGCGTAEHEFLFSTDLADACIQIMNAEETDFDFLLDVETYPVVNIGNGQEYKLADLVDIISTVIGYRGLVHFDQSRIPLTSRRLDNSRLKGLGWQAATPIRDGIQYTYHALLNEQATEPKRHNFVT